MKRFYTLVSAASDAQGGYRIELDGRPVKTQGGRALRAPTQALADALVREWAGQEDAVIPDTMPLTQILNTALDRVSGSRAEMQEQVFNYLDTDLLCYRAAHPEGAARRQAAQWDPWLDWFADQYGIRLETTISLQALQQPAAAHEKVRAFVAALDDLRFTVLQIVTALSGSLVLALGFISGAAKPDQIYEAMRAEENYKAEIYDEATHGPAPHEEVKQQAIRRDLAAAEQFLILIE